ncbi:hypothetical protein T492DRAFT_850534 [Pavlovales sp. CCMP2436]|nr:hypothetical protein T492DRAFT_850534 [Pavlovales sp. CCMP2436]
MNKLLQAVRCAADLSLVRGPGLANVVLLEHLEAHPPLLALPGMLLCDAVTYHRPEWPSSEAEHKRAEEKLAEAAVAHRIALVAYLITGLFKADEKLAEAAVAHRQILSAKLHGRLIALRDESSGLPLLGELEYPNSCVRVSTPILAWMCWSLGFGAHRAVAGG